MSNSLNILVVDDKKVIRDFFDITLGFYGHHITVVHDPLILAHEIKGKTFDIAFVDMLMPGKDGVQVLKELKEKSPQMPVVMISGYSLESKQQEARKIGACGCLKKPFEVEDIKRIIKEILNKDI